MGSKQISGFGGSVTVAGVAVEVKEWNATINHENFDATHLGSSGYRDRKSLIRDFTGSFSAHEAIAPSTSSKAIVLQLGSSGVGSSLGHGDGRSHFNAGVDGFIGRHGAQRIAADIREHTPINTSFLEHRI